MRLYPKIEPEAIEGDNHGQSGGYEKGPEKQKKYCSMLMMKWTFVSIDLPSTKLVDNQSCNASGDDLRCTDDDVLHERVEGSMGGLEDVHREEDHCVDAAQLLAHHAHKSDHQGLQIRWLDNIGNLQTRYL